MHNASLSCQFWRGFPGFTFSRNMGKFHMNMNIFHRSDRFDISWTPIQYYDKMPPSLLGFIIFSLFLGDKMVDPTSSLLY